MMYNFQKSERLYVPSNELTIQSSNLKEYIAENFYLPDNDLDRICEFIESDSDVERMIYELPDLVRVEIDNVDGAQLNFYPEFQDDELLLEVQFIADLKPRKSIDIEDKITDKLYELYAEKSADKILFYVMKYFNL